jgi:hypothetical protein
MCNHHDKFEDHATGLQDVDAFMNRMEQKRREDDQFLASCLVVVALVGFLLAAGMGIAIAVARL